MHYPSVLKIFTTAQDPDYDAPWQSGSPYNGTGSGVLIDGRQILTAAHVVSNQTFIQVQKSRQPDKQVARVVAVSHECDLALLELENPAYLDDVEPVAIGDLPALRDKVIVVGYPIGGEEISMTEGVVSRVEVQHYTHSQRKLLAVTVDAAINSGNSGGPVFRDGKVIGIAFQSRTDGENIGEIVPTPIIKHFLDGVKNGNYDGFPALGVTVQTLENRNLRNKLQMSDDQSGVMVTSVYHGNTCWAVLQEGDVLMAVDGKTIANNGTIEYADRYRTALESQLHQYFVGDQVPVTILRKREVLELKLTLKPLRYLVPRSLYDVEPRFFVYGGLVFQPLTRDYLSTWNKWRQKAPREFVHAYFNGIPSVERQEVIVLTQVLADEITVGYEDFSNESIVSVNGAQPRNMAHFVELLTKPNGTPFLELKTSLNNRLVYDRAEIDAAESRILKRYRIVADRSAVLFR